MSGDNDQAKLRKVLKEWTPSPSPLPPGFKDAVWRRIDRAVSNEQRPSVFFALTEWINTMLPRPALAVSYVMLLIAIGLTAGWTRGNQANDRMNQKLAERYVSALDPNYAARNP